VSEKLEFSANIPGAVGNANAARVTASRLEDADLTPGPIEFEDERANGFDAECKDCSRSFIRPSMSIIAEQEEPTLLFGVFGSLLEVQRKKMLQTGRRKQEA
jgi:hypothetical protein